MKISFEKIIIKSPQKYAVPRRYTSHTKCRIYKNEEWMGDIMISNYGTFKKTVKILQEKALKQYPDAEFEVTDKPYTIYHDH